MADRERSREIARQQRTARVEIPELSQIDTPESLETVARSGYIDDNNLRNRANTLRRRLQDSPSRYRIAAGGALGALGLGAVLATEIRKRTEPELQGV